MVTNMKQKIIKPAALSSKEIELITRLEFEGKEIYTRREIASFCGTKQKADYLIRKLLKKKRLKAIVKNVYFFVPMKAPGGLWAGNEYLIAKALTRGAKYYIGYSSIFNSYGFTDQVAQQLHVINDKYSLRKTIFGIRYQLIKVRPDRIYGLETRKIKNEDVSFPTRERALIDAFEFYNAKTAFEILRNQAGKINQAAFIESVAQYPVQKIRRRIGYFLEKLGINNKLLGKVKIGQTGYSPLYDTGSNKGKINKTWRIIING